jgi:glutathione synthase
MILNGEPLGAILRKAQDGNFICNFHSGGTPHKTDITVNDLRICKEIKSFLISNNIFFAGIDIIGNKLTEINITSPTCVQEINRANKVKLEENVLDFIIHKLDKEFFNAG